MLKPTDKTALVTHKGCLDGTGSAAVFVWSGGRRENVLFRDPKGCALSPEEAAPYDEVWFADLCPWDLRDPAGGKPFRVIDHHDTNIRRHAPHPFCTFDVTRCGTSLLARETGLDLFAKFGLIELQVLVDAIESYDLGRFTEPNAMQLADLASVYSQEAMLDMLIQKRASVLYLLEHMYQADGVSRARELYAEKVASNAYGEWLVTSEHVDGLWCGVAVSPTYWKNDVAVKLLDGREVSGRVPDIAVVIDFQSMSVSLRARGNVNVAKIAEGFNGGGHPNAAGFRLNRSAFVELFKEVFS